MGILTTALLATTLVIGDSMATYWTPTPEGQLAYPGQDCATIAANAVPQIQQMTQGQYDRTVVWMGTAHIGGRFPYEEIEPNVRAVRDAVRQYVGGEVFVFAPSVMDTATPEMWADRDACAAAFEAAYDPFYYDPQTALTDQWPEARLPYREADLVEAGHYIHLNEFAYRAINAVLDSPRLLPETVGPAIARYMLALSQYQHFDSSPTGPLGKRVAQIARFSGGNLQRTVVSADIPSGVTAETLVQATIELAHDHASDAAYHTTAVTVGVARVSPPDDAWGPPPHMDWVHADHDSVAWQVGPGLGSPVAFANVSVAPSDGVVSVDVTDVMLAALSEGRGVVSVVLLESGFPLNTAVILHNDNAVAAANRPVLRVLTTE